MPTRNFIALIAVVLLLSALTIWMASASVGLALLPALSTVALVLSVLIRRQQ
ncbi:hypothetical protein [Salipiger sp. IMCC34102]|uniref:hypothetical protein n=1 Tax=Salipiger sp. IMCC34102 TaxID=2510647 RepID=UPI0013EB1CF0|nr:hypothetical protein [Salipiger sp. IMCC34102]